MALAEKPRETEVNVNTACTRPNFNVKFKTKQVKRKLIYEFGNKIDMSLTSKLISF